MRDIVHRPDDEFVKSTNIYKFLQKHGFDTYDDAHTQSVRRQSWFWEQVIEETGIEFFDQYDQVVDTGSPVEYREWFGGGRYNLVHDALDKHVRRGDGDAVALVWEDETEATREVTYRELYDQANRVANALRTQGVEQGDRVLVYVPNVPEAVAILYGACKLGAIPVPLFSGYGVDSVAKRIERTNPTVAFVADGYRHSGTVVTQKETFDQAAARVGGVECVIVLENAESTVELQQGRDVAWEDAVASASPRFETIPLPTDATGMLLFTSGTTGEPKGTVHTHVGLATKFAKDLYFDFDFRPDDRLFWITDVGWIMGPWSIVGAHLLGGSAVLYSGAISTPDKSHLWRLLERHEVTTFGLSPTAIRELRNDTSHVASRYDLESLRMLGSTGEPWDETSWHWFYEHVGDEQLPIINVSGGTEAGGHFLAPSPIQTLTPCTVGQPTLGVDADIVDENGESVGQNRRGYLVLRNSLPSLTRGFWGNDDRYPDAFWGRWDGLWDHGDWAEQDGDGFWYLYGRADDIINISGRKIAPAEIEDVLNSHDCVEEAVAVGVGDERTQIETYVVLRESFGQEDVEPTLATRVGEELGKPFQPRNVNVVDTLPKTQSGKLRRQSFESTSD